MPLQHTMVPYLWRRHLGIVRAALAFCCLALYLAKPVQRGTLIALVVGAFALYSIFVLLRDSIESGVYQISVLILDLLFFFICALHPSLPGVWLSTVAYFYLLCFAVLLYDWRHVIAIVVATAAFFLTVRP